MQTQDAPAEIMFKLWPWLEANRKRLITGAVAAVVVFFIWFFIATQREQRELSAGKAYTGLQSSLPPTASVQQIADAYLKLAKDYSGTVAAQRAQLRAAELYFSAGRYADAQGLLQKYLSADKNPALAPGAQMGVAACLEAQGKLDVALTEYRAVAVSYPNSTEAIAAKFAQGRVLELQGKLTEAATHYQEVSRSPLAGSLASEAGQRIALIQPKLSPTKPAAK